MKKKIFWIVITVYFLVCYINLFMKPVHAYIDPSAVTYVIQAVAAVLIAIGACLTIFRHKIAALFKKGSQGSEKKEIHFKEDGASEPDPDEKTEE